MGAHVKTEQPQFWHRQMELKSMETPKPKGDTKKESFNICRKYITLKKKIA